MLGALLAQYQHPSHVSTQQYQVENKKWTKQIEKKQASLAPLHSHINILLKKSRRWKKINLNSLLNIYISYYEKNLIALPTKRLVAFCYAFYAILQGLGLFISVHIAP